MSKYTEQSWFYKAFVEGYIRYTNNVMMTRKRYVEGLENLPPIGQQFFIVSNHQNAANDPLNIAFSLPRNRRIGFMTRADAFKLNAAFAKLIRWLGLVPVFRAGWEGAEALEQNNSSFNEISEKIMGGMPIVVFPEGTHAQGHYLLPLSTGTARMAFHVAEQNGWKADVKILPVAHHYEEYHNIQHDFLLTIGQPISLQPYYEEFQSKPYTVLRRVKRLMNEAIQNMMLDEGEADYELKDFLRTSLVNPISAQGRNVPLPQRLKADKAFVAQLIQSPNYAEVISIAQELKQHEDRLHITDADTLHAAHGLGSQVVRTVASTLLSLVLLPVWLVTLWPNIVCYNVPKLLLKTDPMFLNTFRYVLNILLLYPLLHGITTVVLGLYTSWWVALVYLLLWPVISLASWYMWLQIKGTLTRWRVLLHRSQMPALAQLRDQISELLK